MRRPNPRPLAALAAIAALAAPAAAQIQSTLATPLPPGPGVPFVPNGRLMAPILMPYVPPTAMPAAQPAAVAAPPAPAAPQLPADCLPDAAAAPAQRGGQFWIAADFFYAAAQGVALPPLVTLAPPGTPSPQAGGLFQGATIPQFGGRRNLNQMRPGFILDAVYWFNPCQVSGVEASFVYLGDLARHFVGVSAPGGPVLARPVVEGLSGTNVGVPAAGPFPGGIVASAHTSFLGGDANYRHALYGDCKCRVDLLAGYRYLHLGDTVDVWQTGAPVTAFGLLTPPGVGPGTALIHDSFRTRNNFHGPQVGLVSSWQMAPGFTLRLVTKLAMGVTVASADTAGETFLPGGAVFPAGLLVGPSNRVSNTTDYFAVVPEAGLRAGWDATNWLRLNAGYTMIYWSKVRRAADQIDLTAFAPGRPALRNATTDYWVQGWTLGCELRF